MKNFLLHNEPDQIKAYILPILVIALFLIVFQQQVNQVIESVELFFNDKALISQLNWKALR